MNTQRLRFYLHRLKRSSLAEIRHRLSEHLFVRKLRANPELYKKDLSFDLSQTIDSNLKLPQIESSINLATIKQLLKGKEYTLGETQEALQRFSEERNNTFFSEVKWSKSDPDVRAVWEPGRLQHLMILLQHLSTDCDPTTQQEIQSTIQTRLFEWLAQNQFCHGPHYMSVMECGLRLPVFIKALQSLDHLSTSQQNTLLLAIYQHGWLIRKRLSLHSSLGNHTVSECVGLMMAGGLFKQSTQGQEWLSIGINLLEQECPHQILADGGPAEQSFAYHRFVLDLYWLAIHFLTDNNFHDCSVMQQRITRGEVFLQTIQQDNESLPIIGDSDDGFAVGPGLNPVRNIPPSAKPPTPFTTFPDSGYSLLRTTKGLRVLFDHGQLGMEPLNNHGHADCLSIFASVNDKDFLIDPGTFQYNGDPALRRYFKGSKAHNTICIDDQDQARQLTSFVWGQSFTVTYEQKINSKGLQTIIATHDGYIQQNIPVRHSRSLTMDNNSSLTIEDHFAGSGNHEYALHLHLHPSVMVEKKGDALYLRRDQVCLLIKIDAETINLLHGQQEPLAGWYSSTYGEKIATTTIQAIKHGAPESISFTTHIVQQSGYT